MGSMSVIDAQRCVLEHASPLGSENVALDAALGRVLAEDIHANRDLPPYDVSAMDGFAVRGSDLKSIPATLTIVEDIKAGDQPTRTIGAGECARIMTGAPLPTGANAVVRVEHTRMLDNRLVEVNEPVCTGKDIRPRGENMCLGQVVVSAGTEISPSAIGVLATVKAARLEVYRRPRIAILSTGNELESLNEELDLSRIPDSNSYALMGQTQALGINPVLLGIARDDPEELADFLRRGLDFDVLLVSGGSSVGVHDHVRPTLEALGVQLHFWRVEMRPGHPLAFGTTAQGRLVFGLPGNPVSSMVCFEQFVLPALRCMLGHRRIYRRTIEARLAHPVKIWPGRTEFIRVVLGRDNDGRYVATSTGNQSSGVLLSMVTADGLLVVPADRSDLAINETVVVQLLDGRFYQNDVGFKD